MATESVLESGIHKLWMKNFFLTTFSLFLLEELEAIQGLNKDLEEFKLVLANEVFILELGLVCGYSFDKIMSNDENKNLINNCIDRMLIKFQTDFTYLADEHLDTTVTIARSLLSSNGHYDSSYDFAIYGIQYTPENTASILENYGGVYKSIKKFINKEMFHNDGSLATFC